MRHAGYNVLASRPLSLLHRLLLLVGSLLGAVVAQAAPYQLCAGLNDSSGPEGGLHVYTCQATAVSETRESDTFAAQSGPPTDPEIPAYIGTARASSDAFDTVKLFASAQFTDYKPKSYVPVNGATEFAASATANYTDNVTINGPAQDAVLHLSFNVTGTLTQAGVSAQLCYGFAYGGPILSGTCAVGLPDSITVESAFTPSNTARPLNFQFMAVVFNSDANMSKPYDASATADLEHTITMEELLVTTPAGLAIEGITLKSENGFDYPLSPLNQVPAIPEPRSAVLMLAALGLLVLRQRYTRRKTVCSPSTPWDSTASR